MANQHIFEMASAFLRLSKADHYLSSDCTVADEIVKKDLELAQRLPRLVAREP